LDVNQRGPPGKPKEFDMQISPINDPSAWRAKDLEASDKWIYHLSQAEIEDLDKALKVAKAAGRTVATLDRESFPLTVMRPALDKLLDALENGYGVYVIRGLPVERYSKADLRLLYWGVGLNAGTAVSQSHRGDYLGDVKNFGEKVDPSRWRGYMSGDQLGFHTDTSDVVCLFVLQTAKAGGMSMFCSSLAIHDEIARTRPELLEPLYTPVGWSWMEQQAPGESPWYMMPVFSIHHGKFSSRNIRTHVLAAQKFPDAPRLPPLWKEAMDLVNKLANDPRFHFGMMFEAGDFQFLNNHITYHARTGFEDYPEPERRRHLLRMWLSVPNSRELSPLMGAIFKDQSSGAVRGGFPSRVDKPLYETVVSSIN
jgi:hypothetical protein